MTENASVEKDRKDPIEKAIEKTIEELNWKQYDNGSDEELFSFYDLSRFSKCLIKKFSEDERRIGLHLVKLEDFDLSNDPQSKFEWKVLGVIGVIAFRREWKQNGKCYVCGGWHHGDEIIGKFKLLGGLSVYSICETCLSLWEGHGQL